VVGLVLVVAGGLWVAERSGAHLTGELKLSCVLIALGVGMVLTARRSGTPLLVMLGVGLTLALAGSAASPGPFLNGIGDHRFNSFQRGDSVGAGTVNIDLTRGPARDRVGPVDVTKRVGAGTIHVLVPADASIEADLSSGFGDITFLGEPLASHPGTTVHRVDVVPDSTTTYRLHLQVGFGSITVERAPA
jgi:hypothetical protein